MKSFPSKQVQNIFGCSSLFRRPSSFEIFPIDWGPQISQSIIIFRWDLTNLKYKSVLVSLWILLQVCLRSRTKRVLQNSRNNILLLLPEGTVRSSLSVCVLAKMRLMLTLTLTLTDLWNTSVQNRSPGWPQFCFPGSQNKLSTGTWKSTHTSKVTLSLYFGFI